MTQNIQTLRVESPRPDKGIVLLGRALIDGLE